MFGGSPPFSAAASTLIKPVGRVIGINEAKAPPGLLYCFPFSDPSFREIKGGLRSPTNKGTTQALGATAFGLGMTLANNTTSYLTYAFPANLSLTNPFTMEWIGYVNATSFTAFGEDIFGVVNSAVAASVTQWTAAFSTGNNNVGSLVNNGASFTDGRTISAVGRYHFVTTWNGATLSMYANGVLTDSVAVSSLGAGPAAAIAFGGIGGDTSIPGTHLLATFSNAVWPAALIQARALDPYSFLRFQQVPWIIGGRSAPAGITGTLAATEPTDTASIAGTVFTPVTGTLASTEAADTSSMAGTVSAANQYMLVSYPSGATAYAVYWAGANIIPTANQTVIQLGCYANGNTSGTTTVVLVDSAGTLLASTTVDFSSLAANGFAYNTITPVNLTGGQTYTLAAYTGDSGFAVNGWSSYSSAVYGPDFTGPAGAYNPSSSDGSGIYYPQGGADGQYVGVDLVYSAAAVVGITGTLAARDAIDAAAFAGSVITNAALATTDPTDTAALSGAVAWLGTLAATDTPDTAAISGLTADFGALTATDPVDSSAVAGTVDWRGTLAATDPVDTAAASGTVLSGLSGALAATDPTDVAAIAGTVTGVVGALAATDQIDTAAASGTTAWNAALAATDPVDAASIAGSVTWLGILAAADPTDTATIAGTVLSVVSGTLAANDNIDTAAITGTVLSGVGGTLAATEPPDTASAAGTVAGVAGALAAIDSTDQATIAGGIVASGSLSATEATDNATIVGGTVATGTLAATDPIDAAAVVGSVAWTGALAATEPADTAAIAGTLIVFATLAATERPDTAAITGAVISFGTLAVVDPLDAASATGVVHDATDVPAVPGDVPEVPPDRLESGSPNRTTQAGSNRRTVVVAPQRRVA